MSGISYPNPPSKTDIDALKAKQQQDADRIGAAQAKADAAATKADAASAKADSAMTKADTAAAEALTGADRQQVARVQRTPSAAGEFVYLFPKEYANGIVPVVNATAETPTGAAYRNDVAVVEGSTTNKQVTIIVQRMPKTLVASVLGAVLNLFTPVTTAVWVNISVRAPA